MRRFTPMLVSLFLLSACSTGSQHSVGTEQTILSLNSETPLQTSHMLDGKSFDGSIRARGIIGLFSVKGKLSFDDGMLVWTVKESKDIGPYQASEVEDGINFTAQLSIENNETVEWSGLFDGQSVQNVQAVWTRQKGDFVHDLLLPKQVTLDFTPVKK